MVDGRVLLGAEHSRETAWSFHCLRETWALWRASAQTPSSFSVPFWVRSLPRLGLAFGAAYLEKNQTPFLTFGRLSVMSCSAEEPNVEKTGSVDGFSFLYRVPMNGLSL